MSLDYMLDPSDDDLCCPNCEAPVHHEGYVCAECGDDWTPDWESDYRDMQAARGERVGNPFA
jgi:predicted amidophosphoribosyltransferase